MYNRKGLFKGMNFVENLEEGMKWLHTQGAFLTVKNGDEVNTMTISWGSIGFQWSRPVFMALVRKSRYTHEFLEKAKDFTVSIPLNKDLKEALQYCGSKSGRAVDKIKECNLTLKESNKVTTPIIVDAELHYECKILYNQPVIPNLLEDEIKKSVYSDNDYHTLYFGEIVDTYITK